MNSIRLTKRFEREETYELPIDKALEMANNILYYFDIKDSYSQEEIEGLLDYIPSHLHNIKVDIGERENVSIDQNVRRELLLHLEDSDNFVEDNEDYVEDIVELVNEYGETI